MDRSIAVFGDHHGGQKSMKARYNDFVGKQQRDVYNRKVEEMQRDFAALYEKLLIYTLHTVYGYGTKRISALMDEMGASVDKMRDDPVFWDKVDKDVIDNLGFAYPRCDCEYMERVFYKPPKVTAEEKRAAFSDYAKMREFLANNGGDNFDGNRGQGDT